MMGCRQGDFHQYLDYITLYTYSIGKHGMSKKNCI